MMGLAGKNVLVTGASSGIGQAIAIRFGHERANVAVNYVGGREGAEETEARIRERYEECIREVRSCGVKVSLIQADVSQEDEVRRMMRQIMQELGGLDILINNAGIQIAGESHEVDAATFNEVLAVNLGGAFLCSREAIRHWLEEG